MSDVQPSLRTGIAPLAALLASLSPVLARAADEIAEKTTEDTTVILVEQTPKPPWETPAWAYPERGLTFFPDGPGKGKDRWAVGGLWQIAPMFTASYTRGLGSGFSVDARLQTIILYNQLGVGAQWATMVGPFSLGVMAHVNGFFGTLGKAVVATTSFDTTGWGVLLDPGAKAGLQVVEGLLAHAPVRGLPVPLPGRRSWGGSYHQPRRRLVRGVRTHGHRRVRAQQAGRGHLLRREPLQHRGELSHLLQRRDERFVRGDQLAEDLVHRAPGWL